MTWALLTSACVVVAASCRQPPIEPPRPRPSASAHGVIGTAATDPLPSAAECEELWSDYHARVPDDPAVTHDWFLARCARSERAVLSCADRVRADVRAFLAASRGAGDGGAEAGIDPREEEALLRVATPSRLAICMTRERVRFALRTGELDALANEVAGRQTEEHGVMIVTGVFATLPSVGFVEMGRQFRLGSIGEIRAFHRSDGRTWIYLLGGLLGRHQNQVGFLHSTAPFVPSDFRTTDAGAEICIESEDDASAHPQRYMLSCFQVIARLAPNLLEVGAAPD